MDFKVCVCARARLPGRICVCMCRLPCLTKGADQRGGRTHAREPLGQSWAPGLRGTVPRKGSRGTSKSSGTEEGRETEREKKERSKRTQRTHTERAKAQSNRKQASSSTHAGLPVLGSVPVLVPTWRSRRSLGARRWCLGSPPRVPVCSHQEDRPNGHTSGRATAPSARRPHGHSYKLNGQGGPPGTGEGQTGKRGRGRRSGHPFLMPACPRAGSTSGTRKGGAPQENLLPQQAEAYLHRCAAALQRVTSAATGQA